MNRGETEEKKPAKMRSSIACSRCRKSKIKCLNNGTGTQCGACANNGKECTYPVPIPGSSATPKRSEGLNVLRGDGEGDSKRVKRRETESARKHSLRDNGDPLESPPISRKMWEQIYAAFMLNFSTDLPFLHEATFNNRIVAQAPSTRSPEIQDFLLGMLTLTARFVPELVEYHSPGSKDPLAASEFYANALTLRLDGRALLSRSLERCQALLMLTLYTWGELQGAASWTWLGVTISMAQLMGCFHEERGIGDESLFRNGSVDSDGKQAAITREIKRRIVYSCLILDRFQSAGQNRPRRIQLEDVRVQLPCSEEDFRFGMEVKTGSMKGLEKRALNSYSPVDRVDSALILNAYIELVEIWGACSRWSCRGGRREEKSPPWDEKSEFWRLQRHLDIFKESLPPRFRLSASNTDSHIGGNALTVYTAIHSLYSLCIIVLHREYIPFIPINLSHPSGPIDAPLVPNDPQMPNGWWDQSASRIFKSARDIVDLVRAASYRERLVQSPPIALAIFTSAFCGIYSYHFPQIDVGRIMMEDDHISHFASNGEGHMRGATGMAVTTLKDMSSKMRMAYGWTKTIKNMLTFFNNVKERLHNPQGSEDESSAAAALRSLRNGGGALESYKAIEKELKDFGTLDDDERMSEINDNSSIRATTRDPSMPPHVKREAGVDRPPTRGFDSGGWAAVNAGGDDHGQRSTTQVYDYNAREREAANALAHGSYYQHPRSLNSNPPSLIGASNTPSNPSNMSSPYAMPSTDSYRNGIGSTQGSNYVTSTNTAGNVQRTMGPGGTSNSSMTYSTGNKSGGLERTQSLPLQQWSDFRLSGDLINFVEGTSGFYSPTSYAGSGMIGPESDNYIQVVNMPGVWGGLSFDN